MEDEDIRALLKRLGRPHPSGGTVVERVAILAEGPDSAEILKWIEAHDGEPETSTPKARRHGIHGAQFHESGSDQPRTPSRFVLPPGATD